MAALSQELKDAIHFMVSNISKSFIVDWYASISPTNHDFVASCDGLIDEALLKLAELCVSKLDKYKIGQLITSLLHDHILNENSSQKVQSIENQIDNYEYDICQNSVVRLFGLLSDDNLRRVVFTMIDITPSNADLLNRQQQQQQQQHGSPNRTDDHHHTSAMSDEPPTKTTSALYTLVIAMLTKAAFMPIIESISEPKWLYAVIIWLCKKEERDKAKREEKLSRQDNKESNMNITNNGRQQFNDASGLSTDLMPPPASIVVTNTRGYRSLDLEEGIDMASANINFENPICDSLKRPLDNIEIYATEEVKTSGSCYVLYCIRYNGLCYRHPSAGGFNFIPAEQSDVPVIDKRQIHATNRRLHKNEPIVCTSAMTKFNEEVPNRRSFWRSMTIKRRFREFVLLQLRLEENPKIRPYMKNIPKPTKLKAATQSIFSLPGITNIKLDQSTIKLRQRFLERFLIALNNSPFIANSYEFKEFFSYNLHPGGINMSKSKSTILQVNLNKVFVDSVRSAFSLIRSTLPGDDHHSLRSNPDPDAWLTELQQSTLKLHVQTRTNHSKSTLERYIDSKLLSISDSPTRSNKGSSLDRNTSKRPGAFDWQSGSRSGSLRPNMIKSNSSSSNTNSSPPFMSRSSSINSRTNNPSSRSSSVESVYHDASSDPIPSGTTSIQGNSSIQICDNVPIATKFIDIIHYSISKNPSCSHSPINFMTRFLLGKTIERYAIQLLEAAFNLRNAAFCINGITSSIWDESDDDPPLDVEHANLDEAVLHLTKLVEQNYASHTFVPKQLLNTLISKQLRFYLSQLASQKRNKFVIYSFFVHLLDELEAVEQT